jgi:hypothetical protein
MNNGVLPFIIEKVSDTKDGIPNYTVEINEEYLDIEWQKILEYNNTLQSFIDNNMTDSAKIVPVKENAPTESSNKEDDYDIQEDIVRKTNELKNAFGVAVYTNYDLKEGQFARVNTATKVMEFNPNYVTKENVIHEFGHVYIDALGGMSNNFIKRGRNLLKNTDIERQVISENNNRKNPLTPEQVDKEILTVATGKEGAALWDLQSVSPFQSWLKIFFNKIRLALGLRGNVALELANRVLNKKVEDADFSKGEDIWQYSVMLNDQEFSSKEEEQLFKLALKTQDRIEKIKDKYTREREGDNVNTIQKKQDLREELESLIAILEGHNKAIGIVRYVDEVSRLAHNLENKDGKIKASGMYERLLKMEQKHLEGEPLDLEALSQIERFSGILDLIDDVETMLNKEIERATRTGDWGLKKTMELKKGRLNEARAKRSKIQDKYNTLRQLAVKQTIKPLSKKVENDFKKKFEKDFYAEYGGRKEARKAFSSISEMNARRDVYVDRKLDENEEEINKLKEEYLDVITTKAPDDITQLESWLSDPRNIGDELIQAAVAMLDDADTRARHNHIAERNIAEKVFISLAKSKGNPGNVLDLYGDIIEKDANGNPTGYTTGKYHSSFITDKQALTDEILKEDDAIGYNPAIPFKQQSKEHQEYAKKRKEKWKEFYSKMPTYINPQWVRLQEKAVASKQTGEVDPEVEAYKYLTESSKKRDEEVGSNYTLELYIEESKKMDSGDYERVPLKTGDSETGELNQVTYRIPAVEKTTMERLYENGLFTTVKEGLKDISTARQSDIEFGTESVEELDRFKFSKIWKDESGKRQQKIPIFYRGKIKASEQSFDLIGVNLLDHFSIQNYVEKGKIQSALEMLEQQAMARSVVSKVGGKTLIAKITSGYWEEDTLEGFESNAYKALHSLVQDRLYGISTVDLGNTEILGKTFNITKLMNTTMAWTGHTMLMANATAGAVNALQGKYQNFLEAASRGVYSRKNLRKGEALWWMDSPNFFKDIGARVPTSKTNLLVEYFDAFGDFTGLLHSYSDNSRVKRMLSTSTGHFVNHSAEHYIQGTLMYTILDTVMLEKTNEDGTTTMIPAHEAFSVVKEGGISKLKIDPAVTFSDTTRYRLASKIKDTLKQLHGNYDAKNQAMVQRYVPGKMAFMLRKWLVVGTQRRWRGVRRVVKSKTYEGTDTPFSSALDMDLEGYYTTSAKFLKEIGGNIRRLQFDLISGKWNDLTDLERSNIRKAIIDANTIILSLLAANLLAGLAKDADEEDKAQYYWWAYLFRRHYSEVFFYMHPGEALKIMRTPTVTLTMAEKTFHLIGQLVWAPSEEYKTGPRKGELKLKKDFYDLFPVFNQVDRNIQDSYKWMASN